MSETEPSTSAPDDELPAIAHLKKRAFLAAYAVTGTITGAARAAGVSRRSHANWIKDDSDYAQAFVAAGDEAADRLEDEARRRAEKGVMRPVLYKGAQVVVADPETGEMTPLFEHQYSDTLLIFLLKGARREKYRENLRVEQLSDIKFGKITLDGPDLADFSDDELLKFERAFSGRAPQRPALPPAKPAED